MKQISIAEAKNKLPAIIRDVEKGPVVQLTRHGKPVAVLISADRYKTLSVHSNWKIDLSSFLNVLEKSDTEFTDADFKGLRDSFAGRDVEL